MAAPKGAASELFQPLKIANGKIELKHRVILAPLTRSRGVPLDGNPYTRTWLPDELHTKYYTQRATDGGLLVTEAVPVSVEGSAAPGIPGVFHSSHLAAWRDVTSSVHSKGAIIYAQLWHQGRAALEPFTGTPTIAPSAIKWHDPNQLSMRVPPGHTEKVKYYDYPPQELTIPHIKRIIEDFCKAAKLAMDAGFDGVELHGANGYLPEQFLNSNINLRTDEYGGSPEKRTRFVVEVMEAMAKTVGPENVAIRLSPFGLFQGTFGEQRIETWGYLAKQLKEKIPELSYVSVIEPRFEQFQSVAEKDEVIKSWGMDPENIDLQWLHKLFGDTPFFSAGGWNDKSSWGVVESGEYDGLVYGRYFISNPDLVERLKLGRTLAHYDRPTFYVATERYMGYTDPKTWEEEQEENQKMNGEVNVNAVEVTT